MSPPQPGRVPHPSHRNVFSSRLLLGVAVAVALVFGLRNAMASVVMNEAEQNAPRSATPLIPLEWSEAVRAESEGRYADAAALYEARSGAAGDVSRSDFRPLVKASLNYARARQPEKALELWRTVSTLPKLPLAEVHNLMFPMQDDRTEDAWKLGETLRGLGFWAHALEVYQSQASRFPFFEGCVPMGGPYQKSALVEGNCLENLGRYHEAVRSYWKAALSVETIPPTTMRRLVDIYSVTGQSSELTAIFDRSYERCLRDEEQWPHLPLPGTDANEQLRLIRVRAENSSRRKIFQQVSQYRTAAREGQWQALLQELRFPPVRTREREEYDFAALVSVGRRAMPTMQWAYLQDQSNPYLEAAMQVCQAKLGSPRAPQSTRLKENREAQYLMAAEAVDFPLVSSPLPPTLRLPTELDDRPVL